ncbi:type III pantothenate kinase [Leeia sp.]|uniref:type III pantothenate kinase n=1 Tax=Leeia sp. TaxID=2884678 RepID=UPI0035AFC127
MNGVRHLLLDGGNTRLKWAWCHERQHLQPAQVVDYAALQAQPPWRADPAPLEIWGSCVTGAQQRALVEQACRACWPEVPIHWVVPQADAAGVHNGYLDPTQLGPDRWLSLLAARRLHAGDALVVSAGTALTIDALTAAGQFLGGVIAPGLQLILEALAGGTARLARRPGQYVAFPQTTGDALYSGALQAMAGAVQQQARLMQQRGQTPVCLLSGGDASLLAPLLTLQVRQVDGLVLEGLLSLLQADRGQPLAEIPLQDRQSSS